jgi:glutamyl-tRNA reductase
MIIVSVSVNHTTAPLEIREAPAFGPEESRRFLTEHAGGLSERLLLSTCNRTELLAVTDGPDDPAPELIRLLGRAGGVPDISLNGAVRVFRDIDAIRHLFRVASGIESMVLGETQILSQVKAAGEMAAACGATGPVLLDVMQAAVRVARRARSETAIGSGAVSVASAAVELAKKVFGKLGDHAALVVGAGEMGSLASRHLKGAGSGRTIVANRTIARALALAHEIEGEAIPLDRLEAALHDVSLVVTSTSSRVPLLTQDGIRAVMKARKGRLLLVIDIALPRDVEPGVARIEGVLLQDIDAMKSIVDRNHAARARAVPEVEAIVEEAVLRFAGRRREAGVVPTIKALRDRFEAIRREELERNLKRIPEEARDAAARLTESLLNRLLHTPTIRMRRSIREEGEGGRLADAARDLFDLEEDGE